MPRILKLYMWPYWLLSLFGEAKSFIANPFIGSRLLNLFGLHIIRVLLAHLMAHFRWMLLRGKMPKDLRKAYHQDGFVAVPDMINADEVAALRAGLKAYQGTARQMLQGDTATQRILLTEEALTQLPQAAETISSKRFLDLLFYGAAKACRPIFYIQRIRNGWRDGSADPQKNMHADTFHPTMKAWLFLEDVTPEKGPFTYVRGSNRLTWKRLVWEYKRSLRAGKHGDGYSEKGSFRADDADLAAMALPTPESLTAKAGTLVIANTNGFHGRGKAAQGESRLELWAYARSNPFSPLPGFNSGLYSKMEYSILQKIWKKRDEKAAKAGKRATWHLIDCADMLDGLD